MSAICDRCDRDMSDGFPSCVENADTFPYGSEPMLEQLGIEPAERCRDCAATLGGTHHFGCCVAACRRCDGGQYLFCDHFAVEADRLGIQPPAL